MTKYTWAAINPVWQYKVYNLPWQWKTNILQKGNCSILWYYLKRMQRFSRLSSLNLNFTFCKGEKSSVKISLHYFIYFLCSVILFTSIPISACLSNISPSEVRQPPECLFHPVQWSMSTNTWSIRTCSSLFTQTLFPAHTFDMFTACLFPWGAVSCLPSVWFLKLQYQYL